MAELISVRSLQYNRQDAVAELS